MSKTFWWVKLPGNFLPTHAASSLSVSEGVLLEPLLTTALPGFPCAWKPQAWLWHKAKGVWIKLVLIL